MNSNNLSSNKELDFAKLRKFILLEFTRQLIKNSIPQEVIKLQTAIEKKREERLEKTREIIKERIKEEDRDVYQKSIVGKTMEISSPLERINPFRKKRVTHFNPLPSETASMITKGNPPVRIRLSIPETRFPAHIQYIKPIPMEKEIELGKINPLIKDYKVKTIECYGPGENIIVQGDMGTKKTGIILEEEEINNVIDRFSRETRIPIQEGIFKVVAGKLVFLAIISEIVGSKFIIKKMLREQYNIYGM